jgi:hypothetical protein
VTPNKFNAVSPLVRGPLSSINSIKTGLWIILVCLRPLRCVNLAYGWGRYHRPMAESETQRNQRAAYHGALVRPKQQGIIAQVS